MRNSIVVYQIMSETEHPDENVSFAMAMSLIKMGIIELSYDEIQVHRTENTTITVYTHRKVS